MPSNDNYRCALWRGKADKYKRHGIERSRAVTGYLKNLRSFPLKPLGALEN